MSQVALCTAPVLNVHAPGEGGAGRLVLLANRLPVTACLDEDGRVLWKTSSGGLVQTLGRILGPDGLWIGCTGMPGRWDVEAELADAGVAVSHRMLAVPVTEQEHEEHYLGFSNRIIWPLFHDLHPYCSFRASYWDAYNVVVDRFAEVAAAEVRAGDVVWVHDYHLIGAGDRLRQRGFVGALGFFLHVPFPATDIFRRFPWHRELIRSLLAYDRLGFQTRHDARNFLRCLDTLEPGAKVTTEGDGWRVRVSGRVLDVGAYPIGIDVDALAARARSEAVQRRVEALAARKDTTYILGLERLDYTKGIPERLQAFRLALRHHPELHGRISLIQHVDPSREDIDRYKQLRERIEQLVGSINGEFGDLRWTPVHYSFRHLNFDEVVALLRVSDVALVTPVRDGMNLVAKEFCTAHDDEDGVLILSEFTGAAQQLAPHAILVNPHDVDATAEAIQRACTMPRDERQRRMRALRAQVAASDVRSWATAFLEGLRPVIEIGVHR